MRRSRIGIVRSKVVTFLFLLLLLKISLAEAPPKITPIPGTNEVRVEVTGAGNHKLEIDDAASFRVPVVSLTFQGTSTSLHFQETALIPGIRYRVRLDRQSNTYLLMIGNAESAPPALNCEVLRRTWREKGRFYTGVAYSQLKWDDGAHRWTPVLPAIPIGEALFNVELMLRPALSAARACNDLETLDEIALYYTAMLEKSEPIGSLLKMPNLLDESRDRMRGSDPSARTFPARFGSDKIGEGELFNSQWLHPAALLVRLISQLPERERTPGMRIFLNRFVPFLVREQLLRFLVDQPLPMLDGHACRGRVGRWELAMQGLHGDRHWDTALSDIDLWLLTSAAEVLGAHANDPENVVIEKENVAELGRALQVGVHFFQSKRAPLIQTANFKGQPVESASYFNGDYDGLPEMRGTAVTGKEFPVDDVAPARQGASWDIGHMYRVAIFLRTLYENRKATGVPFPQYRDLQLVVNQYLYKVFNGDFEHPLFRNNFDGSDGWFRVGYNGPGSGQPPSPFCDMHDVRRLCMTPGSIIGWPELSFVSPDLNHLEQALISMAFDARPATRSFSDRYYYWIDPFRMIDSSAGQICGGAFYAVAAENADRLSFSGSAH
jgi:hypothetical protein